MSNFWQLSSQKVYFLFTSAHNSFINVLLKNYIEMGDILILDNGANTAKIGYSISDAPKYVFL